MGTLSKTSVNLITKFLTCEIDKRVLDGITYTLVLNDGKHNKEIEEFNEIRKSLDNDGFTATEVFRRYDLSNGYIYDLDLSQAVALTVKLSQAVAKMNNGNSPVGDMNISKESAERRSDDLKLLAKKVIASAKEGKNKIEVALFSRNKVPRIVVSGTDRNNKAVACQYDAFAIRHLDLEEVNSNYLVPTGLRIVKIETCEILPTTTGVRCILYIARA